MLRERLILDANNPAIEVLQTRRVLTHAQILALPTTPVIIVPSMPVPLVLVGVRATAYMRTWVANYTNIDAAAELLIATSFDPIEESSGQVSDLLAAFQEGFAFFKPGSIAGDHAGVSGQAIGILADNNGMGAFTGGNAATTLVVDVDYYLLNAN